MASNLIRACALEIVNRYNGGFWRRLYLRWFGPGVAYETTTASRVMIPITDNLIMIDFSYYSRIGKVVVFILGYDSKLFELADPGFFDNIFKHIRSNGGWL